MKGKQHNQLTRCVWAGVFLFLFFFFFVSRGKEQVHFYDMINIVSVEEECQSVACEVNPLPTWRTQ